MRIKVYTNSDREFLSDVTPNHRVTEEHLLRVDKHIKDVLNGNEGMLIIALGGVVTYINKDSISSVQVVDVPITLQHHIGKIT